MAFRKSVLESHERERQDENQTERTVYESLSDLTEVTLCKKDSPDSVYKTDCLNRNCARCGLDKLVLLPEELDTSSTAPDVKWDRYEYCRSLIFREYFISRL
jgi:hypothetical protein